MLEQPLKGSPWQASLKIWKPPVSWTVRTVQETGGFQILRDACQGEPFKGCSNILKICNEIAKDPIITKTVGSKFQDCPI